MTNLKVVERSTHFFSDDEDCIALYENNDSYIYYVRNYVSQTEFIIISHTLMDTLPEEAKTLTGVYVTMHFGVLKYFQDEVTHHVMTKGLLAHFHYLFNCTVSRFIEQL
ncbi:hypothetical protein KUL118_24230 [Tenacibaculum sp. KUL118]|jgi:hypothetical protein|nr:hypothetical protein KUL118_24230 [Tenacibaculum sp. KUL118]